MAKRSANLIVFVMLVWLAACQPVQVAELPTLVPQPTATPIPTDAPTLTPFPSLEPSLTPSATPPQIVGRAANDPLVSGIVRAIHAAPDTPAVDIYIDSAPFGLNIEYGLATGRTNVLAGAYQVRVVARGSALDAPSLAETPLTLAVGQSVFVVLAGVPDALNLTVYDESTDPLDNNVSRVNFIQTVAFAPLMTAQQNGITISPEFDFGAQSGNLLLSSGQATLSFASSEQTLGSVSTTLVQRTHYTLMLIGRSSDLNALQVLVFDTLVPGRTSLRAVHAVPNADAVDVYVDDVQLAGDLAYAAVSDRQTRSDGTHTLKVYAAGADITSTAQLFSATFNAAPGDTLSLLLLGAADDLRLLAFKEDLAPMIFDTGRIAFINGWAEITAAQIGTSSDVNPAIGQIAFGQGSAYVPLPVGTNRVFWQRVDGNGQGGIAQDRDPFITENGLVYLYILTSDRDPVIITDSVEVITDVIALPTAADVFVEVTPIPRTRIRVVNALYEQLPFDFVANGEIVATNLGYGQASALVELGDFITVPVSIAQPGASVPLIQRDLRLLEVGDYSVYVYGAVGDVSMIAFSDQGLALGSAPPSARVINLAGDASITLGLADAEATDPNTPSGGTAPGIPIGTLLLLQNIGVQSVSPQIPTFGGVRDLIVVDQRTNTEAARFRSFNFVSSTHYDVVVTYLPLEGVLRAFILPY